MVKTYKLDNYVIGNGSLSVIAGPCSLENFDLAFNIASEMKKICEERGLLYVFKASFDKANRTSSHSWRGPGLEKGLEQLAEIKAKLNIPVLTDIHESWQAEPVGKVVDVIQIPAFLCRQTDLLVAAAKTGKIVNIKKAQFLEADDMQYAAVKCREAGNDKIILCERGIRTFETATRNTLDLSAIPVLKKLTHLPVIIDPSHATGKADLVPSMAIAAVAAGADGVLIEVHNDPQHALCDGSQSLRPEVFDDLAKKLFKVHEVVSKF
ncbi:MAG: 3-deoxy-8-phosphooctulonate synthase [Synergistaceae bacterium]|nr:3-deoxy-8-phosphooctulonate synthase [Synergistaceae bacterium]